MRLFALLLCFFLAACGSEEAPDAQPEAEAESESVEVPTRLSQFAADLEIGMSREEVVDLLGPADWAVLPGDTGRSALPDPRISLRLYWENPGCTPVVASFGAGYALTGVDQGRWGCEGSGFDPGSFNPDPPFACSQEDRRAHCVAG